MRNTTFILSIFLLLTSGCAQMDKAEMSHHLAASISERQMVQDTVTRLFVSTDNRDWQAVQQLFADEVLFDMTSLAGGEPTKMTPEQIVTAWDAGLKPLQAIHHQTGNYLVEMKEDSAELFCYGIASHYLENKTGNNTRTFVGSYDFHLVRVNGEWKIDGFKFNLKYLDGNLQLESS